MPIGKKKRPMEKQVICDVSAVSILLPEFFKLTSSITKNNPDVSTAGGLTWHVRGCALNSRESQKVIYCYFYGYAMSVCERYTNNKEDAMEILNDGFLKIFKEIHHYKPTYNDVVGSFKGWLRKIMTYTAIDKFRKNRKHRVITGLDDTAYELPSINEDAVEKLSYKEIIHALEDLSPAYQAVFKLFVIGGLSHDEISEKLDISIGTSKSNLSKARKQLQNILFKQNHFSVQLAS
jgi:RNA polymerase sigma factor (sigma-70 family)